MPDQATSLRDLVSRCAREESQLCGPKPRLVAMLSGQRDVGCTTVAINLAVAAAHSGRSVVLLDGDFTHGGLAERCRVEPQGTLLDVLSSHKLIDEILLRGPAGIQIAPGPHGEPGPHGNPGPSGEPSPHGELVASQTARRLPSQLQGLGRFAELLIVDLGAASEPLTSALVPLVDDVLLVTTPDATSLMDTYATIKSLPARQESCIPQLIVNQAATSEIAADVHQRIDRSCRQFLAGPVDYAGHLPTDHAVTESTQRCKPVVTEFPKSCAARALRHLAQHLSLLPPVAAPAT